jgi:hypothetical protein
MSDNLKMLLRYLFAMAVAYGQGKGWFSVEQGNEIIRVGLEVAALVIGFLPAAYAWFKVDNAVKS